MLQVHGKLSQQDTDNSLGKPVSIFLGLKESVSEAYGSGASRFQIIIFAMAFPL
jgi:hypothetical protein